MKQSSRNGEGAKSKRNSQVSLSQSRLSSMTDKEREAKIPPGFCLKTLFCHRGCLKMPWSFVECCGLFTQLLNKHKAKWHAICVAMLPYHIQSCFGCLWNISSIFIEQR